MDPNTLQNNINAVAPEASNTPNNPTSVASNLKPVHPKPQKSKGLIATSITCAVLAVAGIGFGVYGMLTANQKSAELATLQAEPAPELEQLPGTSSPAVSDAPDIANRNGVVSAPSSDEFYSLTAKSGTIITDPGETYNMSVAIQDGQISSCSIFKVTMHVDADFTGSTTAFDHDCEISGLTGNVYRPFVIGEGQDSSFDSMAFLMTDGTVQYLPIRDAIMSGDFSIKGTLNIDGFVTDMFTAQVGTASGAGGYYTTLFALDDGTYVKYDQSMFNQ